MTIQPAPLTISELRQLLHGIIRRKTVYDLMKINNLAM
jgi:hypothetical protein